MQPGQAAKLLRDGLIVTSEVEMVRVMRGTGEGSDATGQAAKLLRDGLIVTSEVEMVRVMRGTGEGSDATGASR